METTRLSSKGQIIIPKAIRQTYQWPVGQEFIVEETDQGILLRPQKPFSQTQLKEVAGCLKYSGQPKTLEEMEEAIRKGVRMHNKTTWSTLSAPRSRPPGFPFPRE